MYHHSSALSTHGPYQALYRPDLGFVSLASFRWRRPASPNGDHNSRNKHGGAFEAAGPQVGQRPVRFGERIARDLHLDAGLRRYA